MAEYTAGCNWTTIYRIKPAQKIIVMNAFRKYAVWIVGLGLAAFIIPSIVGSIGKFSSNTKPSVKQPNEPYEPPFRVDGTVWAVNGTDTATVFETEYATTPEAIEIGMMYRRSTPPNRAMLFFMPGGDQLRSFWMKNTLVALDIIYINATNDVVSIQANAEPLSTKSLPSAAPASYVLEVLGGQAAAQGITVGTKIYWSPVGTE